MAFNEEIDVTFSIYGLPADDGNVRASVFLTEVRSFLNSLRFADKAENRAAVHDYLIVDLQTGSGIIKLREKRIVRRRRTPLDVLRPASGINYLRRALIAVYNAEKDVDQLPKELVRSVADFSKRAGIDFDHAEIQFDPENVIRIDDYLTRQVDRLLYSDERARPEHFAGTSFTSFDGVLKVADARGALVRGKFVLTVGGKQIDCVFRQADVSRIREAFNLRARAEVIAHYDGESLLPIRLEIRRLVPIKGDADLTKWQGALAGTRPDGNDET